MKQPEEYDITVVGGGIAGLYCCLKAPPGARVALFEATDRIGGKLETVEMSGFKAEYGAMRFDPSRQPLIKQLIADMGLETEPFPEYASPSAGNECLERNLRPDERGLDALQLFARGIARVLNMTDDQLMAASAEELDHLRREGKHRGKYLWDTGFWNAISDVLSHEAIKYIMSEGSFFHGFHENPGFAGTGIVWVKMLQMSPSLKGIKGGMQQLTDRMLEKAKQKGVIVRTGRRLQAVASAGSRVSLQFDNGESCTAAHAVLGLPAQSLQALKGLPANIRPLLDSVVCYPLLKAFFVVREPWWQGEIPNVGATTLPCRELHYYRRGDLGNIMLYADRPSINYWRGFVSGARHDHTELNQDADLAKTFARYMKIDPAHIESFGIRDWLREPYGAGVHLWRAGWKPWEVAETLSAFPIESAGPATVHICGEAYSDYQGFMEGALSSSEMTIASVLG